MQRVLQSIYQLRWPGKLIYPIVSKHSQIVVDRNIFILLYVYELTVGLKQNVFLLKFLFTVNLLELVNSTTQESFWMDLYVLQ